MDPLLQHLAEMTAQRDHALLDLSVVSTLHELTRHSQVRLLEVFAFREELFVRKKVWIHDGKVVSIDEDTQVNEPIEPIANYAALAACVMQGQQSAEELLSTGNTVLWLPIWLNDKVIACIEFTHSAPLNPETRSVIEGIVHVYRNYQSLLDYSERDSLTGLLNRKTFDEKFSKIAFLLAANNRNYLPHEMAERRKQDEIKEQWLAVVDIDHFKKINDEYGHLYGDEVLILMANLLRSSFRAHDRIFRFGGEEFVILLRNATLDNARKVFDRFRRNVENYKFPQVGKVTISLGFVGISSNMPVVILGHADQALYHAKSHGRNQVCFYDELVGAGLLQSETSNSEFEFF